MSEPRAQESPSHAEASLPTSATLLREALALTEATFAGAFTLESVTAAVEKRAPLIAEALAIRANGGVHGPAEAELASRIEALDARIVAALWATHADAYHWLRGRSADLAGYPALAALVGGADGRPELPEQESASPAREWNAETIRRYRTTPSRP